MAVLVAEEDLLVSMWSEPLKHETTFTKCALVVVTTLSNVYSEQPKIDKSGLRWMVCIIMRKCVSFCKSRICDLGVWTWGQNSMVHQHNFLIVTYPEGSEPSPIKGQRKRLTGLGKLSTQRPKGLPIFLHAWDKSSNGMWIGKYFINRKKKHIQWEMQWSLPGVTGPTRLRIRPTSSIR